MEDIRATELACHTRIRSAIRKGIVRSRASIEPDIDHIGIISRICAAIQMISSIVPYDERVFERFRNTPDAIEPFLAAGGFGVGGRGVEFADKGGDGGEVSVDELEIF
jgi:hypothetical protein